MTITTRVTVAVGIENFWIVSNNNNNDNYNNTNHLISARWPGLMIVKKKKEWKRTYRIVDFAIPVDSKVKIKESEKVPRPS